MDDEGRGYDSKCRFGEPGAMIRLLVSNQRGGVGKTTTVITLSRYLVDEGRRVLLIDTDPQGSIETVLGVKASHHLAHFVAHRYALSECIVRVSDHFDVLCSNRETLQAEAALMGAQAREVVLQHLLERVEKDYDAILIDSAPSISILQTCAMFYARNVLIPVDMDSLSVTGAGATITAVNQLNEFLKGDVRVIGFLPTQVDRRLQMTQAVLQSLAIFRDRYDIPVLPEIRVDSSIPKSLRARKMLADYDPACRAMQDYRLAFSQIIQLIEGGVKSAEAPAEA
jgi:chromosome partitioning protein